MTWDGEEDPGTLPAPASENGGSPTRRGFLRTIAGLSAVGAGLVVLRRVALPPGVGAGERRTLAALLDTFFPADGYPGWREAGIDRRLVAELSAHRRTRRGLVEGLGWLERTARRRYSRSFALLPEARRTAIVAEAADHPPGSLPRYFYRIVRDRALALYCAQPAFWRRVGMPHPPQPDGYPRYWEPPRG